MAMNYRAEIYAPRLKEGIEYQDFICCELHNRGIVLQNLQSKKWQFKKENLLGLEIKYDKLSSDTGNLYIETHEKADPANPHYVQSGIYRDDETWLYGIGTYQYFFIFSKKTLRTIDRQLENYGHLGLCRKVIATSKGFLIPKIQGFKWAERYFDFEEVV